MSLRNRVEIAVNLKSCLQNLIEEAKLPFVFQAAPVAYRLDVSEMVKLT